ncbi:MAG: DUF2269 domain-containing protein [Actinomycetota bacterium]|nr:DUF2269 domain-containing protein [Actinomycetota bacterium]
MPTYFEILILVHIASAIIGFGPTYAFSILGPMAAKRQGPEGITLMEGMIAVEKKLVIPAALVVQPLSGTLLIFEAGWNNSFFSHTWLWIAILLYVTAFYLALGQQTPALEKMVAMAKDGKAQSPEFGVLASKVSKIGPALGLMLAAIIVLMVLKPGT